MLTLLPFENAIYKQHNIPVQFVGHPLADKFPLIHDQQKAKSTLIEICKELKIKYDPERPLLACLPGSRGGEVKLIGPVFWESIAECCQSIKNLQVIVPAANTLRRVQIEEQLVGYQSLPITIVDGFSHEVMAASDAILLASGTTALEAMLLKKPMVVVYKIAALSYWILLMLVKTPYLSLPNLLAGKEIVPELIQYKANVKNIVANVLEKLESVAYRESIVKEFTQLHRDIKGDADRVAAKAIVELLAKVKD
jgi:lipid-A-disaccharide synthase